MSIWVSWEFSLFQQKLGSLHLMPHTQRYFVEVWGKRENGLICAEPQSPAFFRPWAARGAQCLPPPCPVRRCSWLSSCSMAEFTASNVFSSSCSTCCWDRPRRGAATHLLLLRHPLAIASRTRRWERPTVRAGSVRYGAVLFPASQPCGTCAPAGSCARARWLGGGTRASQRLSRGRFCTSGLQYSLHETFWTLTTYQACAGTHF